MAVVWPMHASADQAGYKAQQGLMWARWNKCEQAIPLLEEAELLRHQAHVSLALADCYASKGKLMEAVELYRALSEEKITPKHLFQDRSAIKKAPQRLADAQARLPTVTFETSEEYPHLEVFLNGVKLDDPFAPKPVAPDMPHSLVVRANGYDEFEDEFTLREGEHFVRPIVLTKSVKAEKTSEISVSDEDVSSADPWFGGRGRVFVIPGFFWRIVGDGGRTVFAPGGALSFTTKTGNADLMLTVGYAYYGWKPMPLKGRNAPETDWEIVESSLHNVNATVELAWRSALDDGGHWEFYWGGGIGLGWALAGDILRTQAYPPDLRPGDPYTYQKCAGPNDPPGSYLYCNELDHDANHYGYAEPNWFAGGKRPFIYPWLAFPQLGITYHPSKSTAVDLETGLTTGGLLLGLGVRAR